MLHDQPSLRDIVVTLFARDPRERSANEICHEGRIPVRKVYPLLARLERDGLLTSRWRLVSYPRRRLYKLGDVDSRRQ